MLCESTENAGRFSPALGPTPRRRAHPGVRQKGVVDKDILYCCISLWWGDGLTPKSHTHTTHAISTRVTRAPDTIYRM